MELSSKILSDITIYMKYSRYLPELKRRENWNEIVERNLEIHIRKFPFLEDEIRENYKYVFEKKVLPSLRSLQFAGKPIEISPNRQYNCAYLAMDDWRAFSEAMFLLLGGTGIGFSVQRHHIENLPPIRKPLKRKRRFLVGDSIEGWADAIKVLMKAYFFNTSDPEFDFSDVRPKGSILVTSGGKAPGPQPLKDCIYNIRKILDNKNPGDELTSLEVHDIVCFMADAVLAGGIRRSATISFFSLDDIDMMTCKFDRWWEKNPQRARANNSAVILRNRIKKQEFLKLWNKIKESGSGEPGIFFTNDINMLSNVCGEISLKNCGLCNLTTMDASTIVSQEDLNKRIKAATFIGTLQASYTDFHYLRDLWKKNAEKEALLGVSMTGVANEKLLSLDLSEGAEIAKQENIRVAQLIGINPAHRITTIKPEGSSSLVLGTSSGIHAWHNDYYIRRLRVGKNEAIYKYLKNKLPKLVEDDFFKSHVQAIISIPIKAPDESIFRTESALNLLERIKKFNTEWITSGHISGANKHNVSSTVYIKEQEWDEVGEWMWKNRSYYGGLAVLPYDGGSYIQAPFEDCSKEQYEDMLKYLKQVNLDDIIEEEDNTVQKEIIACSGGSCAIT